MRAWSYLPKTTDRIDQAELAVLHKQLKSVFWLFQIKANTIILIWTSARLVDEIEIVYHSDISCSSLSKPLNQSQHIFELIFLKKSEIGCINRTEETNWLYGNFFPFFLNYDYIAFSIGSTNYRSSSVISISYYRFQQRTEPVHNKKEK